MSFFEYLIFKENQELGASEMAEESKASVAIAQDLGKVTGPYVVTYKSLQLNFQGI